MKVGLISNWTEHCAVAEYARNLVEHCQQLDHKLKFTVVKPDTYEKIKDATRDCDVIHFNYAAYLFKDMTLEGWGQFRGGRQKIVMTLHESADYLTRNILRNGLVDELIVHAEMRDGLPDDPQLKVIPFGVKHIDLAGIEPQPNSVAAFGCAFPWKGLHSLAYACGQEKMELTVLASEPSSEAGKIDFDRLDWELREHCPNIKIQRGWQEEEKIIRTLASHACVAFPFDERAPITGISSSVRYGLAARRPIVLRRTVHFSDLFPYEMEMGFYSHSDHLRQRLRWGAQSFWLTNPYKLDAYEDLSWKNSAKLYLESYKGAKVGQSFIAR